MDNDDVIIALLRGINVGGRNRLKMQDLRDLLAGLGARDVKTTIQSGNVVFRGDVSAEAISTAIGEAHGFTPNVHLVTADEFRTAIANNPFNETDNDPKMVYLYFLDGVPAEPNWDLLTPRQKPNERIELIGNVVYLHSPDGMSQSKIADKVERAMGVSATARNWRTVNKIAETINNQ